MSNYTPTSIGMHLGASAGSGTVDDRELNYRMTRLADLNPYMAQRPDVLATMAQYPVDTESLMAMGGQMYAMQTGGALADQLKGLSPATQRAIVSRLTPGQQGALGSLGYQTPQRDEGSILGTVLGAVAKPLSVISHGVAAIPGVKPAFDATFEGLTWLGNQPGHLYRALQIDQGDNNMLTGLGAALGVGAALALAPVTGGGSLAALGILGAAGLAGGTAAAALQNPGDWQRAFNTSWNGERTFRPDAIQKASDLLGDPRLTGVADDLSAAGVNPVDLAHELAGHRDQSRPSQMRELEKLAGTMAAPGTDGFQQAMKSMLNAMEDPTFQQAVQTLNNGKISIGRDLGSSLGLDQGSGLYNLVSGGTDALFTIAVDPTLMLGYGSKFYKAKRYTFDVLGGAEVGTAFRKFVTDRPAVQRTYSALADAVEHVESGGLQRLRQNAPHLEPLYADLVNYRQELRDTGRSADAIFSTGDVLDYLTKESNLEPILKGVGSVRNARGVQLASVSAPQWAFRQFRGEVRSLVNGMADISVEAKLGKLAAQHGVDLHEQILSGVEAFAKRHGWDYEEILPTSLRDSITEDGMIARPWMVADELHPNAYATGRAFAGYARQVPIIGRGVGRVGEAMTAMTTMSIAGKTVSLSGEHATTEIRALSELGRYMGMPSYWRRAWADTMLAADSPTARYDAIHGWMANMMKLTGIEATDEGRDMVGKYLETSKKLYDESDEILVNGHRMNMGMFLNEQADKVVMPNLHEMRRAAVTGGLSKMMGITDLPVINAFTNKIWKPAVLLRLGFIPRAAGEELASFLLRGGIGGLVQQGEGRFIGSLHEYEEALRIKNAARVAGTIPELTRTQVALLDQGIYATMPAHVRPLYRIMARGNWTDPVEQKMLSYRDWLATKLTEGAGAKNLVYGAAGGPSPFQARQLERTGASFSQLARLNASDYADNILLGNPLSWRRMMLGGVSNDAIEAGGEWARLHSTTVMRELSSTGNGSVDPGYAQEKLLTTTDSERPIVVTVRGERQTFARGDDGHAGATLDNLQRSLADPAFRADALEHLTRVAAGTSVQERELGAAADNLFGLGRVGTEAHGEIGTALEGSQARVIMRELIGPEFKREQWDHMLTEFRRSKGGSIVATSLDAYLKDVDNPTLTTINTALANAVKDLHPDQFRNIDQFDTARSTLLGLRRELGNAKPTMTWLDNLPLADREFAAQFLDGQMLGGNSSFWARHRGQGADAPEQWLYRTLSEANETRVKNLTGKVLDPHYHDAGVTKSLRMAVRDDQGQLVDTAARNATVMLYDAPSLPRISFDEALAQATDRDLLLSNRPIVEKILSADPRDAQLVADYRLADELHRIDAKLAGLDPSVSTRPRMMRQPRKVTDGRIHNLLIPDADTATSEGTRLWSFPREAADKQMVVTPDEAFNPAEQWARDMVGRHNDLVRRGTQQTVRVRARVGPGGEEIPLVYRWNNVGDPIPVSPTEEIKLGDTSQFIDDRGNPIHYGDQTYFSKPIHELNSGPSDDVTWEMLGPSMRDAYADQLGAVRVKPKGVKASFTVPGRPVRTNDLQPLLRASVNDVKRVPLDDLPGHAIGEVEKYRTVGKWEQFVRFGFDRVIGPSIDAVIRKPMAFHHFMNRYIAARDALRWTLDPELVSGVNDLVKGYGDLVHSPDLNPEVLADAARTIHSYHGEKMAAKWSDEAALAWLRGHTEGELGDLLTRTVTTAAHDGSVAAADAANAARKMQGIDYRTLRAGAAVGRDPIAALDAVRASLPAGALDGVDRLNLTQARNAIRDDPFLSYLDDHDAWGTIVAANKNVGHQRRTAGELAAHAAIADAMPFIDSHHLKTQFADYGSGFAPFWYAEENFMKRWARGLSDEGPALIRKAMLGYMGLKQTGVIRTDEAGRDWFVYPGSGLLADALSQIPGLSALHNAGMLFETPTDQMLPGLNNRFGAPSFAPLVSMSMEVIASRIPEMQPVERAVLGDFSSGRSLLDQVTPSTVRNVQTALFGNEHTNKQYASAMMTAISFAVAHGQDPGDDATPAERERFMDRISRQTRVILLAQTIGGFAAPGSPSLLLAGKSASLTGRGAQNPADYLSDEYRTLVRTLGIEEGTQRYLELNKDAAVDDVVNPLAYNVPRYTSTSGAPMPSTEQSLKYVNDNADYFKEFPNAAPWLIPQVYDQGADRSQYAFDQQVIDGMRHQRTPDDFYAAIKFKQGAQDYFATKDAYMTVIDQRTAAGDKAGADQVRQAMDNKLQIYRIAHPLFADELASSDGRVRRGKVLAEMRIVVEDPNHPDTPQFDALRTAVRTFDSFQTRRAVLSTDHSMTGRRETDFLSSQYEQFMLGLVAANPAISSFWSGVLKPESNL